MNNWRQFISVGLVVALLHLSLADVAWSAGKAAPPGPTAVKQQVDLFGVGANVKLKLADGKKLKGSIQGIEDGAFVLASKQEASPTTRVAYDQVAELKLAKVTYKTSGKPDAAETRRVIAGLGVGRHIVVKTTDGAEYHGKVVAMGADHFTILPDHQRAPIQIAYSDALLLSPNPTKGTWIAIGVLAGIGIAVLAVLLTISSNE